MYTCILQDFTIQKQKSAAEETQFHRLVYLVAVGEGPITSLTHKPTVVWTVPWGHGRLTKKTKRFAVMVYWNIEINFYSILWFLQYLLNINFYGFCCFELIHGIEFSLIDMQCLIIHDCIVFISTCIIRLNPWIYVSSMKTDFH